MQGQERKLATPQESGEGVFPFYIFVLSKIQAYSWKTYLFPLIIPVGRKKNTFFSKNKSEGLTKILEFIKFLRD